jgi:alkanesulfonate monooxygenase SsuD/methylene tetrahydromethanopterin reductase-like flavin-dependent oxidoreductase (luciferase family)
VAATVRIGAQIWPQTASWPVMRDAVVRADRNGFDSLWTWDHLMAIVGPWEGPNLEGWTALAAWASVTRHATLGLMVGANTFRNPGLTAKLATTLDHISDGRAILGIGGAWFEREHDAFGIEFGSTPGWRLDRLEESVSLIERLLAGERIEHHEGPAYRMHDALAIPTPVQQRLPICIGGSGPNKTLRTVARHADIWNTDGSAADAARKDATLRERCAEIGRDPDEIERTATIEVIIRDDPREADRVLREARAGQGQREVDWTVYAGPPQQVADQLRPHVDAGFRHFTVDILPPYDPETLDRLPEVRALLQG